MRTRVVRLGAKFYPQYRKGFMWHYFSPVVEFNGPGPHATSFPTQEEATTFLEKAAAPKPLPQVVWEKPAGVQPDAPWPRQQDHGGRQPRRTAGEPLPPPRKPSASPCDPAIALKCVTAPEPDGRQGLSRQLHARRRIRL